VVLASTVYVVGSACGVTELDGIVYAVFEKSPIIKTYSADTLSPLGRDIHVEGMRDPIDIVACRRDRQLYIAEYHAIWRVTVDGPTDQQKWLSATEDGFRVDGLSVTSQHLLVTSWQPARLRQYRLTDGRVLCEVTLPGYMKLLLHGVETERNTFIIAHRLTTEDSSSPAVSESQFLRATAVPEVLLRARISYGNSVCLSVRPSVCLSGVSRPGTESSPGEMETPGFHRMEA